MIDEGQYLYCITGPNESRSYGPVGIGGRGDEVTTISYEYLSGVISNTSTRKYVISRENMTCHEKVIEKVMAEGYTVLPVRFCTIAESPEEIRDVLRKRRTEFNGLLKDMDNKVELGLKAIWKDMKVIFGEIAEENERIGRLRDRIARNPTRDDQIELGEMVKKALEKKKEREAESIINSLKKISVDFKANDTFGDNMFMNAAFLVDRSHEKEFDNLVEDFMTKYSERTKFKYVGPTPPFNFVNIVIHWEGRK
ncbi:MAG: GvpL/GvpF family gas vesicle protein [bacterium]|nr:GvpL/GvpF family gas vesicle protein [bacterium]